VYVLSQDSRLEAKTGKAGLFGFAGHSHLVRARAFSGRVVYYPSAPADSRVEVSVGTDSLEVLTPPDTAEIRKVTEAMRAEVLHVDQYPLITFVSTALAPTPEGFHVEGRLTIAGQTRDVAAELTVAMGLDTLRANGSFSVKQTDFGIRPYRGGPANTVRVADRVSLTLEVVGIRLQ
jgi:polyisoprenoid-binding protein YceI